MSVKNRFICMHGHFYQPPRENPWLEEIEVQDSAHPFHDWNERILHECYYPNNCSRILNNSGHIIDIVNNYSRMSFNVGPTLMNWIRKKYPELYSGIVDADRKSRDIFSGHGNAIAQGYNHTILPLSSQKDKDTQIKWGITDFKRHFGREPEAFWLPEMAVDIDSLRCLVDNGIRYTLLSQYQAYRIKKIGQDHWEDASGGNIDITRPYRCMVDETRFIDIFFYHGEIAKGVAFEGLLNDGKGFAGRLKSGFSKRVGGQLVHIATDGESYGHHHRFGDMALSFALDYIEKREDVSISNYGEFLERYPSDFYVEIAENSSWSCAHGIERWRSNCGCNTGGGEGWNQKWRKPLRESLDWLKERFDDLYETDLGRFCKDPWAARNDYVDVIFDRTDRSINSFFEKHQVRSLTAEERIIALKLLEVQRNGMLMYTSCGWFFNDISGIETSQIMMYAAKGIQLAEELGHRGLEEGFLDILGHAKSNIPEQGSGREIYKQFISKTEVNNQKLTAQYAILHHFYSFSDKKEMYSCQMKLLDYKKNISRGTSLSFGRVAVRSLITGECQEEVFSCLFTGGHDFDCRVMPVKSLEKYEEARDDVLACFSRKGVSETISTIDTYFGVKQFAIEDIFIDERRKIINDIIYASVQTLEEAFGHIYLENKKLMDYLSSVEVPIPEVLLKAAEFTLKHIVHKEIEQVKDVEGVEHIASHLSESSLFHVNKESTETCGILSKKLLSLVEGITEGNKEIVSLAISIIEMTLKFGLQLELWMSQNAFKNRAWSLLQKGIELDKNMLKLGTLLNFSMETFIERGIKEQ